MDTRDLGSKTLGIHQEKTRKGVARGVSPLELAHQAKTKAQGGEG